MERVFPYKYRKKGYRGYEFIINENPIIIRKP